MWTEMEIWVNIKFTSCVVDESMFYFVHKKD